jgi:hypothetical protein
MLSIPTTFESVIVLNVFAFLLRLPGLIIYCAFLGSNFGIARDILTGGNYYAGLKNAFSYFRRYWWRYFIIAIIFTSFIMVIAIGIILLAIPEALIIASKSVLYLIIVSEFGIAMLFGFSLLILWPASLTATGSLKKSFQESFRLFRQHWKFILKSFCILFLPLLIVSLMFSNLIYPILMDFPNGIINTLWLVVIFLIFNFLIVPIFVSYSSCLYNALISQVSE